MQGRIGASTSPIRVKPSGVVDLNVSSANVIAGEFEVVMQRAAQLLARLRDEVGKRIEAFFRDDHVSKSDSDASAQQHSDQIARRPVWDAWSWPEPRVEKKRFSLKISSKPSGPTVAHQNALDELAEFCKAHS